jgi:hypothetical protein
VLLFFSAARDWSVGDAILTLWGGDHPGFFSSFYSPLYWGSLLAWLAFKVGVRGEDFLFVFFLFGCAGLSR